MTLSKNGLMFAVGGSVYVGLELLWRGWSHPTMFIAGGSCFLLLGKLNQARRRLPMLPRAMVGAGVITLVELLAGLLVNRDYAVWDYRRMPLNFYGQICLPFSLLWIPIAAAAMVLHQRLDRRFQH